MLRIPLDGHLHAEVAEPAEISWRAIELNRRSEIFVDFAQKVEQVNPGMRYIGSVWSPPVWLKLNRALGNGSERRENRAISANSYQVRKTGEDSRNRVDPAKYEHFVQWLVAVVEYHDRQGLPLYGLSFANEPRFSQWYGSCVWTADDYAEVLAMLGQALEDAGHGQVIIFGPEDMTGHLHGGGTGGMVEAIANDSNALKQLDRWATHGYTDGVQADSTQDSSAQFWELVDDYGKPYWMTEGGTGGHDWPEPIRQGLGMALHNSLVAGHASAFLPWQIAESKPRTHAIAVDGNVTPKTPTGMQFFRTIPIGAQRISAEPAFGPVKASAYRHPDSGATTIVLINPEADAKEFVLELQNLGRIAEFELRATSADATFKSLPTVRAVNGKIEFKIPAESMISLVNDGR